MNAASVRLRRFVRVSQANLRRRLSQNHEVSGSEYREEAELMEGRDTVALAEGSIETQDRPVLVSLSEEQESDITRQLDDLNRQVLTRVEKTN